VWVSLEVYMCCEVGDGRREVVDGRWEMWQSVGRCSRSWCGVAGVR
jgi:hypothetical protein